MPSVTSQPIPGPQEPEPGSREPATESGPRRRRFLMRALKVLAAMAGVWLLSAYVILPALWRHYEHQPALESAPKTTRTAQGIPGDPLNVGLIGTEEGTGPGDDRLRLGPRRPGYREVEPPHRQQRASRPPLRRCTRQQPVRLRTEARPRLREAGRRQRQPSPSRPVLEFQGTRPRRGTPVDRGGNVRPQRRA